MNVYILNSKSISSFSFILPYNVNQTSTCSKKTICLS